MYRKQSCESHENEKSLIPLPLSGKYSVKEKETEAKADS